MKVSESLEGTMGSNFQVEVLKATGGGEEMNLKRQAQSPLLFLQPLMQTTAAPLMHYRPPTEPFQQAEV